MTLEEPEQTPEIKKKQNFMAPFYGWVQLPQGYSHFEEAVYFLLQGLKVCKNEKLVFKTPFCSALTFFWFPMGLQGVKIM